jgi:hypothetical protein
LVVLGRWLVTGLLSFLIVHAPQLHAVNLSGTALRVPSNNGGTPT